MCIYFLNDINIYNAWNIIMYKFSGTIMDMYPLMDFIWLHNYVYWYIDIVMYVHCDITMDNDVAMSS